jgi:hypothetical protein
MTSFKKNQVGALGVNYHEAHENYFSSVLKQRQASVHMTPYRVFALQLSLSYY